jgi:hypothetical protein
MRVRFLSDYRGKLTGEQFYQAGDEADLETGPALVAAGRAEACAAPVAAPEIPVEAEPPKTKGRKR